MEEDDLDRLEDRIDKARAGREVLEAESSTPSAKTQGSRAGGQFLSYVIAGGLFGYFLDRWLETLPWMMLTMFVVGFGLGVHHANKAMNKKD